ncbi:hypothetical protein ACFPOU_18790 [Massilia jejuensis]|uniref:Uncharacterized protein n=1 Tax=Massilia jejuensis TaxID=648894 RepID=A0ABW0PNR7_9BURK
MPLPTRPCRLAGGNRGLGLAAWLFIALVALFLTHPTAEQHSVFEGPLPLPAELEPLLPAPVLDWKRACMPANRTAGGAGRRACPGASTASTQAPQPGTF